MRAYKAPDAEAGVRQESGDESSDGTFSVRACDMDGLEGERVREAGVQRAQEGGYALEAEVDHFMTERERS